MKRKNHTWTEEETKNLAELIQKGMTPAKIVELPDWKHIQKGAIASRIGVIKRRKENHTPVDSG
jgi:hypothetical protein